MAEPWWADLGTRTNAMLAGLQRAPFVLDPSTLTGDATYNRQRMYSGAVPRPEPTVNPTPGAMTSPALGNPLGATAMPAMSPMPTPQSSGAPASIFAPQAAAQPAPAASQSPSAAPKQERPPIINQDGSVSGAGFIGDPKIDWAANPYDGMIFRGSQAPTGINPQTGQPYQKQNGTWEFLGNVSTGNANPDNGPASQGEWRFREAPAQAPQMSIPPELQTAVTQLFKNWFGNGDG